MLYWSTGIWKGKENRRPSRTRLEGKGCKGSTDSLTVCIIVARNFFGQEKSKLSGVEEERFLPRGLSINFKFDLLVNSTQ